MCCGYLTACVSNQRSYILINSLCEQTLRDFDASDGIPSVQRVYSASLGWRSSEILSHYQVIMLGKRTQTFESMACIGT
ncbi:Leucine--tRNA ligase [Gossypium arboreum]|uniref:Leucine--tRNA ligase n=1 Tax=Gossypium arboreum TaxID=29729 RepID=A0A0B0PRR1_GOSAR|nr:Leucine--tRNA ligase [Gossypium arboreum]